MDDDACRPGWSASIGRRTRLAARAAAGVLVMVVSANAAVPAPAGAQTAAADRVAVRSAPSLGVHSMLYLDAPPSFKRVVMAQAAALGASLVRVDVPLALIHPAADAAPDFTLLDDDLRAARETGVGLVGIIEGTPPWAAGCGDGTAPALRVTCPYADVHRYAAHVTELARRSRGVVKAWEVFNEPESTWFTGTPRQYARMLDTAIDAVHAGDPAAQVVIGGVPEDAVSEAFVAAVLQTPGLHLAQRIDVANVHVRGALTGLAHQVRTWRRFMRSLGVARPVWVTEFGYPSDTTAQQDAIFGGALQSARFGGGQSGQASYLRRALPALLRGGAAKVFVTLRDGPPGTFLTEGLFAGTGVADPPVPDPVVIRKEGFGAVQDLVDAGALQPAVIRAVARTTRRRARMRLGTAGAARRLGSRRF